MEGFILSQPELVVLSKVVLGIPLPPLGFASDPELAQRPFEEVAQEVLDRLAQKGWVERDETRGAVIRVQALAEMLRVAGYLVSWMIVRFHDQEEDWRQVGFYHDGKQVVRHELNPAQRAHLFQFDTVHGGESWLWDQVAPLSVPDISQEAPQFLTFPAETLEHWLNQRLEGRLDLAEEEPSEWRLIHQDVLSAPLILHLDCLCSVYRGDQERLWVVLGAERNWMLVPQSRNQGEEQVQAKPATRTMLRQTLSSLWNAWRKELPPEG